MGNIQFLPKYTDNRGTLFATSDNGTVPFETKNIFFIRDVPKGESRGNHVYMHTEMVICLSGSCKICWTTQIGEKECVFLSEPGSYTIVPAGSWRTLSDFSADCILGVLTDAQYSTKDYCPDLSSVAIPDNPSVDSRKS